MTDTHPPRRSLRTVGAVLAGMIAVVILSIGTDAVLRASGIFPPQGQPMSSPLFLLATAYRTVYSVAGSYIAAGLAPDRPMAHALALGILGLVVNIFGLVATWHAGPEFGPKWYPLALALLSIPSAWVGGKLHRGPSSV